MQLNISQTKKGWNAGKVEKVFKFLSETMNSPELCMLTERLLSDGHITVCAANSVLCHIKNTFKDVE